MRLATLMLSAALVLGMGLSGNTLAHGYGGHGYSGYAGDFYRPHYRHRRHPVYRHAHRPLRHGHRPYYRPYYRGRHDHDDSWYGIHLFFGGH